MPVGRVLPRTPNGKSRVRALTPPFGDYNLATTFADLSVGSYVVFSIEMRIVVPTARDAALLTSIEDAATLAEACGATDSDARRAAAYRLAECVAPDRFATTIARAFLTSDRTSRDDLLHIVGDLLPSQGRQWREAFWSALPSEALGWTESLRLATDIGDVDDPAQFDTLFERIARVADARERDRLAKAAIISARDLGRWLGAVPSRLESTIGAVRSAARSDYLAAFSETGALRADLEARLTRGPLPEWLVSVLAESLSLSVDEPALRLLAAAPEEGLWQRACLALIAKGDDSVVDLLKARSKGRVLPREILDALPARLAYEPEWMEQVALERVERDADRTKVDDTHAEKLVEAVRRLLGAAPSRRSRAGTLARARHEGIDEPRIVYLLHLEREALYARLPEWIARHARIVEAAPPRAVVRRMSGKQIAMETWASLPIAVRMVWTHKELWGADALPRSHPLVSDATPQVASLRALFQASEDRTPASDRAAAFDRSLRGFLLETVANSPDVVLDLRPLLPDCMFALRRPYFGDQTPNVAHCEGRFWKPSKANPGGHDAWCPRCAAGCLKQAERDGRPTYSDICSGARVDPVPGVSWELASVVEIFATMGAEPRPTGLAANESYGTALGGWANRLNEIREKLVCGECQARLEPNLAYARRTEARYNKTFFLCPHGHYAQPGRYFNHCWCCEQTIDSDESRHQAREINDHGFVHGLYYCFHCGAGPEPALGGTCDIGTKCPACGLEGPMEVVERDRDYVRLRCASPSCTVVGGHEIKTPLRAIRNRYNWAERANGPFRLPFWWPQQPEF